MAGMTSIERTIKALNHEEPDRVPLFTFAIDPKFIKELGGGNVYKSFEALGLDIYPVRNQIWCQGKPLLLSLSSEVPPEMRLSGGIFGGWEGVDEFGRIWKQGSYIGGVVKSEEDIAKYVPPLRLEERTDPIQTKMLLEKYEDKALCLMSHAGPFGLTIESMCFENFFLTYMDNRPLIKKLFQARTEWFAEIAKYAGELGVHLVVMGDDVAYKGKTFISPQDFNDLVIPAYKKIVDRAGIPIIWHSDGYITPLLEGAIRAGLTGVQGLEPTAGVDLGEVKKKYGDQLVLVGNVDCGWALCQDDLQFVRREVERCMAQGKAGGGYILSDSNSLHEGCKTEAILEMFRYAREIGSYH